MYLDGTYEAMPKGDDDSFKNRTWRALSVASFRFRKNWEEMTKGMARAEA
jgi:hypothetical protein